MVFLFVLILVSIFMCSSNQNIPINIETEKGPHEKFNFPSRPEATTVSWPGPQRGGTFPLSLPGRGSGGDGGCVFAHHGGRQRCEGSGSDKRALPFYKEKQTWRIQVLLTRLHLGLPARGSRRLCARRWWRTRCSRWVCQGWRWACSSTKGHFNLLLLASWVQLVVFSKLFVFLES